MKNILIEREEDVEEKVKQSTFPALIKSQVPIGSRKKAGLIKIAQNQRKAISLCYDFFKRRPSGFTVEAILIEELVEVQHEYYCSIVLDASERQFFLIVSKEGGIDIEEVAQTNPDAIIKENFSYKKGLKKDLVENVATQLGFTGNNLNTAIAIFMSLWDITRELEAQLVEINPLVLTTQGLKAVDGKMILDDDAAFRQPLINELQERKLTDLEKIAKKAGFSFVKLNGEIGILANGAGLTMALLDLLFEFDLKPANFLDVGGGANKERVYKALKLLFGMNPKCVLVNIYGGITRCDVVAEAIIQALGDFEDSPPLVIRLIGTNDAEGISLLKNANINAYKNVMEAVQKVREVVGV